MHRTDAPYLRWLRWRRRTVTLFALAILDLALTSTKANGRVLLDPFLTREAQVPISTAAWIAYPAAHHRQHGGVQPVGEALIRAASAAESPVRDLAFEALAGVVEERDARAVVDVAPVFSFEAFFIVAIRHPPTPTPEARAPGTPFALAAPMGIERRSLIFGAADRFERAARDAESRGDHRRAAALYRAALLLLTGESEESVKSELPEIAMVDVAATRDISSPSGNLSLREPQSDGSSLVTPVGGRRPEAPLPATSTMVSLRSGCETRSVLKGLRWSPCVEQPDMVNL